MTTQFQKVTFYNYFHNGDLHLSRQFVRRLMETFPQYSYSYAHRCSHRILSDIAKLKIIPTSKIPRFNAAAGSKIACGTLYLNTWYGSYKSRFNGSCGIAFDALYDLFNHNFKTYFEISCAAIEADPTKFFPVIDFSKVHKTGVDNFISNSQYKKHILISNGASLSGQAANFSFAPVLQAIVSRYPSYCFIVTNKDDKIKHALSGVKNIKFSRDIIGELDNDLNENSYLSKFCDLVVGRSSGVYTFCMTQENMFHSDKIMVSFSNIGSDDNKYWLGHKFRNVVKYRAKVFNYNIKNSDSCIKRLNEIIKEL